MGDKVVFKVVDYVEHNLDWEAEESKKMGVDFEAYQLKFAPPAEIIEKCGDADFLCVDMTPITEEIFSGLEKVKVLIRHGIGYDKVDVEAATEHGIIFANQASAFCLDVAEHTVMLIFAVTQKLMLQNRFFKESVSAGNWNYHDIYPVNRLTGKTVGIIGCGNIGSLVMKKMKSLDVNFLVCDPYKPKTELDALGVKHTPLEEVLGKSDIVSLFIPVTDETKYFFDYDKLSMMKKTAMLINTARGQVLKTSDLIRALKEGKIAGAGLDVHEGEPPPVEYGFFEMDNVICTPHFAWYTEEGGREIRHMIMGDFKSFLDGVPPKHVINTEVLKSTQLRMKLKKQL
ncbi:C-terminal binding protein [Candidatus Latescibacterota bacterium]